MNELYCSEDRVETLKRRAKRCCCKYCGGPLTLKRITFNDFEDARIEIYCDSCDRIEYGVEPEIYRSSAKLCGQSGFQLLHRYGAKCAHSPLSVAKICEIMAWGFKNTGMLDAEGFTVPLKYNDHSQEQCLIITRKELEAELEE